MKQALYVTRFTYSTKMTKMSEQIRITKKAKKRLSSILKHRESFADGVDMLLFHWQFPRELIYLRKGRTVIPPFEPEEKQKIQQMASRA